MNIIASNILILAVLIIHPVDAMLCLSELFIL